MVGYLRHETIFCGSRKRSSKPLSCAYSNYLLQFNMTELPFLVEVVLPRIESSIHKAFSFEGVLSLFDQDYLIEYLETRETIAVA